MRSYQAICVEVIERFGGRVAQYLGDGILVYFGHPQAHDDDAERAVRAGLGIVAALAGDARLSALARPRSVFHGAARVAAGDSCVLSEILDGLAGAAGTGNRAGAPGLLALVAVAQQSAGRFEEARASVAGGLALASETGQHYTDADLHRLEGEFLLAQGGDPDAAAERYQQALATARAQGARAFELRAATSLAPLWHNQGKSAEARALLVPIYGWFTEGHDTGDLIEAKALLDELA